MQRTFREEFYTWSLPGKIPEPRKELDAYLNYYNRNRERPHRAQNGLASLELLAMIQREMVPKKSQVCLPITCPCLGTITQAIGQAF